ncbi:hypothetical protein DH09_06680 [Bacillaceae bacterium JMAK1]|nr:hypothetical protein DH09_06680 [Bacillaceae bacterium JMAK1]
MYEDYNVFVKRVHNLYGIDLSMYKSKQMMRRTRSFYERYGFVSYDDFFMIGLTVDRELEKRFIDRITINVSEFYRNRTRWMDVRELVLPELLKRNEALTIWSAACSSGEEAYTLSTLFCEQIQRDIKIVATDIDESILMKAKRATYAKKSLRELLPHEVTEYFNNDGNNYTVKDRYRASIKFSRHDLLNDPYFKNVHLITCRNVLIYFTEEGKDIILKRFVDSLTDGGFLFVGSTEQIFAPERYGLETYGSFIYRKTSLHE